MSVRKVQKDGDELLVCSVYGMSETCAYLFPPMDDWRLMEAIGSGITQGAEAARAGKWDSLGPLLPGIEARLVVDESEDGKGERDANPGESGELWVRGDVIMKYVLLPPLSLSQLTIRNCSGYLNNPTATAETVTADGWLKTGDVAIVDNEGFFQVVDRKKELIKYSGFQVPPAQLEAVLCEQ